MTSSIPARASYDAVVVGARCAGAATAMLLARAGLRVLCVERSTRGADTVSTHALMRGAVLQLHRWGLLERVRRAGTPLVRRTSFHYPDETVQVHIKPDAELDGLYAPRRTLLDAVLASAAAEAGAEMRFGARLVDLERGRDGSVRGVALADASGNRSPVHARLVVGADGLWSSVARLAGASPYRTGAHATAVLYGYWSGLPVDGYEWHYAPTAAAGAIPTNDGQTCVFAAVPAARLRLGPEAAPEAFYRGLLAEAAPPLSEQARDAQLVGGVRGFGGQPGYFRQCWGEGWALVGDAGYFRDPLTAHGITDALRDAELLARAVIDDTKDAFAAYQATRDRLATGFFEASDAIASFAWTVPELKQLHLAISREMKREAEFLRAAANRPGLDRAVA